jgi:hypothetical protein
MVIFRLLGLGLWCLRSLSTIFQLYRCGQFYWWKEPEYREKTTNLSPVIYSGFNECIKRICQGANYLFNLCMHCPVHNFSGNKHVRNKIYRKFYINIDLNIQQKEV